MGIDGSKLAGYCVNIVSQQVCNGRHLAVAVNLDALTGQAVVAPLDPTQPSQLWLPILFCELSNPAIIETATPAFVNVLSGQALYYAGSGNQPIQQIQLSQLSLNATWTMADLGGGWAAIRAAVDDDQNWGIASAVIKAGISTVGWDGGTIWDSWTCVYPTLPSDPALTAYLTALVPNLPLLSIIDLDSMALSDNGASSNNIVIATPSSTDASQQWLGLPNWRNDGSGAFQNWVIAFANASTGNLVRYSGSQGQPLTSCALDKGDGNSTWTLALCPAVFGGTAGFAVRPACDDDQNINVTGESYVARPMGIDVGMGRRRSRQLRRVDDPLADVVGSAVSGARLQRLDTQSGVTHGHQLVPPLGATWGQASSDTTFNTSPMSWNDDSVMNGSQTGSAALQNQFYVYWVDGVSTPYYIALQRQTLAFAPGSLLARATNSYGFFQYLTSITNTVTDGSGNPFAAGVASLLYYSPTSFNPSPAKTRRFRSTSRWCCSRCRAGARSRPSSMPATRKR